MRRVSSLLIAGVWLAVWTVPPAQGQPGPPGVRCELSAATHVSFGDYHPLSALALDSMGSISLRCTGGGPLPVLMVQLSRGGGGGFLPRAMVRGQYRLEYNLYLDAGRTVVWGDGTAGTATYTAQSVRGRTLTVPIFARIPPRQRVATGLYSDSIVMTLLY